MKELFAVIVILFGSLLYLKGAVGIINCAFRKGNAWFVFCIFSYGIGYLFLTAKYPESTARSWIEIFSGFLLSILPSYVVPELYYN